MVSSVHYGYSMFIMYFELAVYLNICMSVIIL